MLDCKNRSLQHSTPSHWYSASTTAARKCYFFFSFHYFKWKAEVKKFSVKHLRDCMRSTVLFWVSQYKTYTLIHWSKPSEHTKTIKDETHNVQRNLKTGFVQFCTKYWERGGRGTEISAVYSILEGSTGRMQTHPCWIYSVKEKRLKTMDKRCNTGNSGYM